MQSLFDRSTCGVMLDGIDQLLPTLQAQWGQSMYKHLQHHLQQFGA